ncbi:TatD DNase family protein [Lentibacillus persicus]|uniref:TatD DNase family protein n=1 Tax=Lentibacillus persicus TaxID=640948 RepID=A0A1I1XGQ6_9BACI|nr:TatD family hydrolase [Lentibacillus persicus]SFE04570.1 TatD DNase family protein [Lentibacillus persicus]
MSNKIIDAHIHLDMYKPDERSGILRDMEVNDVDALIAVSNDLASAQGTLRLAHEDNRVKPALGFHPEQPLPADEEVGDLLAMIEQYSDRLVAIGEVGLPYYIQREGKVTAREREAYVHILDAFIQKAAQLNKPVALHAIYEDAPEVVGLLEKHSLSNAHFHWFKGDSDTMLQMRRNGYFISVTPDILYKNKTRELARQYPLDKMMAETDGPWPFEGPFKGKMTHPYMIHHSVRELAALKRVPAEDVYKSLYDNTRRLYKF